MDRWDIYFLEIVNSISSNSQCLSKIHSNIGAILVKDKSIVATGYNGPARDQPRCDCRPQFKGMMVGKEGNCPRHILGFKSGEGLDICPAAHAEINAIANAARLGVQTIGTTMYVSCEVPCSKCLPIIINAGIEEIVCTSLTTYDKLGKEIINESNLRIRTYQREFYERGGVPFS